MSRDFIHSTPDRCLVLPRNGCAVCGGPVVRSRSHLDYIACKRRPHYFASFDWQDLVWRDEKSWQQKSRFTFPQSVR